MQGEKYDDDEISQNIRVNNGDIARLRKLLLYMGIQHPDSLDFKSQEQVIRSIAHHQIGLIKKRGDWKYPDYSRDIAEQVLGVDKDDNDGLIALANEFGMTVDKSFNLGKNSHILKKLLKITKRRRDQFLIDAVNVKKKSGSAEIKIQEQPSGRIPRA